MNRCHSPRDWATVFAALCLLLVALLSRQALRVQSSRAALPAPASRPGPPPARKPVVESKRHARPATPVPRQSAKKDPWACNFALRARGTTVTGGHRPELLIDGNKTAYTGSEGFGYTHWPTKPLPAFTITFREGVRLNAVRFLLWDRDNRFYRYRLEASPALARDEWVVLADRTDETHRHRGWQVIVFKTLLVCRLRLTGTYNSANSGFHVVEFEAHRVPDEQARLWSPVEF